MRPVAWIVVACVALLPCGCGGGGLSSAQATGMHDGLSAVTDAVDPAYGFAVAACDASEAVIVARAGTTAEQDAHDMADTRAACDRLFHAFEALRQAQLAARAAVDAAALSNDPQLLAHALTAVEAFRSAWVEVRAMVPTPAPRPEAP